MTTERERQHLLLQNALTLAPPGPVSARFLADRDFVSAIMGPIGSAKTSTCLTKLLHIACEQAPHPVDRWRRTRFVVVRDTYRRMRRTTLESWFKRIPRGLGKFNDGGDNAPSTHRLAFNLPDGTRVDTEIVFAAIGDNDVEDFCRGFEATAAYVNELDRLSEQVLQFLPGRCGRFPEVDERTGFAGCSWYGTFGDLNAPDFDSWVYKKFFEELPDGWSIYVQPGGRDPGAENLQNLVPGYYDRQMEGQEDWYIHRMIDNKFGYSRAGKPVYPQYNDLIHCSQVPLLPERGLPLVLSFDAGSTPAMVVRQAMPNGQRRILDELATEPASGYGPKRFSDDCNRLLFERYNGIEISHGNCDPAAQYGGDSQTNDDLAWMMSVAGHMKIRIRPAWTNTPSIRQDAVRNRLTTMIDGRHPGLLISSRCKVLRRGFNNGYQFRRVQVSGRDEYRDEPRKNHESHVHDALQYDCLDDERGSVMGREAARSNGPRQVRAVSEDYPSGEFVAGRGDGRTRALMD